MVIDIQNFNSIKTLHYEISDSKINFLFGISGSGKSSIAYALTDLNKEKIPNGWKRCRIGKSRSK